MSVEDFILFIQTDGEVTAGGAKRVEEVWVCVVVVVVVVHVSNLSQIISSARIILIFFEFIFQL